MVHIHSMKRIKIHKQGSGFDKIIAIVMVFFLTIHIAGFVTDAEGQIYVVSQIMVHLFTLVVIGSLYLKSDHVNWSKNGMTIKLKNRFHKSIHFNDIREVQIQDQTLIIKQIQSDTLTFDVSEYAGEDVEKLAETIKANTVKMYANRHWARG